MTSAAEVSIVLSADGLTVFLASNRADAKAKGGHDVWTAKRAPTTATFGAPVLLETLNSPYKDYPSNLSADGCRLYLQSNRSGVQKGYVAERPK